MSQNREFIIVASGNAIAVLEELQSAFSGFTYTEFENDKERGLITYEVFLNGSPCLDPILLHYNYTPPFAILVRIKEVVPEKPKKDTLRSDLIAAALLAGGIVMMGSDARQSLKKAIDNLPLK